MPGDRPYKPTWPRRIALLDHALVDRDMEWEREIVERLSRGEAGPRSLSTDELTPSEHAAGSQAQMGWEEVEHYARNANRTGAVFLNDSAIEWRRADRERRKAAWAEFQVAWEAERAAREARAKAWAERAADERSKWVLARIQEDDRQRRHREALLAARAAEEAEWERIERERARAKREAEAAARKAERWAGREAFFAQRRSETERILGRPWECSSCGTLATIAEQVVDARQAISVYRLKCACADRVWYHDDLVYMMMNPG